MEGGVYAKLRELENSKNIELASIHKALEKCDTELKSNAVVSCCSIMRIKGCDSKIKKKFLSKYKKNLPLEIYKICHILCE